MKAIFKSDLIESRKAGYTHYASDGYGQTVGCSEQEAMDYFIANYGERAAEDALVGVIADALAEEEATAWPETPQGINP